MLTNCAFEDRQVIDDFDGVRSAFYLYAVMETMSDLPATPETEDMFRQAQDRLVNFIETSGLDDVTLSRLAETLSGRQHSDDP